jgi:hypothetical protein
MWIHVLMKVDGGGTASLFCQELQPDPIFPEKIVLKNVQGLSWPVSGKWMKVHQWSVEKSAIVNWMVGEVRDLFDITPELIEGIEESIPWPEGSHPHVDLSNHPEELDSLVVHDPDGDPHLPVTDQPNEGDVAQAAAASG